MTKKIWTTFTFQSPKNRKITNLFKNTNIWIEFKTTTTLHHLTKPVAPTRLQEHEKKVEYTNLRERSATKIMSGRQVET
jgi:hypothetical protein